MMPDEVNILRDTLKDLSYFDTLNSYKNFCVSFLRYLEENNLTRIISPTHQNYIFFQYPHELNHHITRPLNTELFYESSRSFINAYDRFLNLLYDIKKFKNNITEQKTYLEILKIKEINKIIYTLQQSIGCIGDTFENPNQSRKRIGQLFEKLIKLIIQDLGFECNERIINIPIPGYPDNIMQYQLDMVFSFNNVIITSENPINKPTYIYDHEIVGSIKTTSKDRIDKIFIDKYLLSKLLGRDIRVIAIFLHDVQRASIKASQRLSRVSSDFGINSTFKTNHFLGYSIALTQLDGVYYVDPRPDMIRNEKLADQIKDFQQFLIHDLWILIGK